MNPYKEVELKNRLKTYGEIEITVVDNCGNSFDEKHTDYDEAKDAIAFYENEHTVYF